MNAIKEPAYRCRPSCGECQREFRWQLRPCQESCAMADYLEGLPWA